MTDLLEQLEALEREIRYDHPPDDGRLPFVHLPGALPLLISAPHGAVHRRNGEYKAEDEYTAALARYVAAATGAHVLYAWALAEDDPNWEPRSPYKDALAAIVARYGLRFVLDLHGMSNRHRFGVAVGTIHGTSCPQAQAPIAAALQSHGFVPTTAQLAREFTSLRWDHYVIDHGRFTGGVYNHTITRFVSQELGIEAAQFELCSSLRVVRRMSRAKEPPDFCGDPDGIRRAVALLSAVVRAVGG